MIKIDKEQEEYLKLILAIIDWFNQPEKVDICEIRIKLEENTVPKSKIKEKIEELNETRQYWTEEVIKILQELLEEG